MNHNSVSALPSILLQRLTKGKRILVPAVNKVTAAQGQAGEPVLMVLGPPELPEAGILISLEARNINVGIK